MEHTDFDTEQRIKSGLQKRVIQLLPPIIAEVLFIILCVVFPRTTLYIKFFFYLFVIFYFRSIFSFGSFRRNLRRGRRFWIPAAMTGVGVVAAYLINRLLRYGIFSGISEGTIALWFNGVFQTIIYFMITIIMEPIAQNLFYRKGFIDFSDTKVTYLTAFVGMVLLGLQNSLGLLGVIEAIIIAIPLSYSYIKTRNIYIAIFVHFCLNCFQYLPTFAYVFARLSLR